MIYKNVSSWLAGATLTIVAVLGGVLWSQQPEHAVVWAVSIGFLPGAWLVLSVVKRSRLGGALERDGLGYTGALTVAGLIMAASLGFTLAEHLALLGESATERGMGIVMGGLLVLVGNVMPKMLKPLAEMRCDPAKLQSLQRSAGWIFVLAGLGYALSYVLLPVDRAALVSSLFAVAAIALVAPRLVWLYLRRRTPPKPAKG